MIDLGLLVSVVVVVAVGSLVAARDERRTGVSNPVGVASILLGIVTARLVAMAFDDRVSLLQGRNLLILRSGMELWPGIGAAMAAGAWSLHRRKSSIAAGLAVCVPGAVASWSAYEASCIVRSSCQGPSTAWGLVPAGLTHPVVPIGALEGIAGAALVVCLRRRVVKEGSWVRVSAGLGGVALIRSVASFWLPSLGDGLTRQHLESIAVAATATVVALVVAVRGPGSSERPSRGIERSGPSPLATTRAP